ncbi:hypothetical protein AYO20_03981 [Fonsecaea nubica]|uniref:FAD/NAD(P)-binding domain-containing protein n=1 Tax=Fonsecaea nubica TaxID=856822 RepID=A0A178D3J9_9EURO|nr:hypothetical protein AYO20_03981 [Fonsecaea nubica]OAL36649.1 hypothetical protein AYO20_03981 [Fonsecaea nubica]
MFTKAFLYIKLLGFGLSASFERLCIYISTYIHRLRYKSVPDPRNVVIIGGSFAGYFLAKRLAESLPTGYRVVLIDKHSHFHFTWNFPRATVLAGQEHNAIIPYPDQGPRNVPVGAYVFKQGSVIAIEPGKVILQDGTEIAYDYLAVATGSRSRYPARLDKDGDGDDKANCVRFFQEEQQRIVASKDIVIVGGGAAGVEVASDIKSKYPQKSVTLVHSRDNLLNNFGAELHDIAKKALEELGIKLYLGDRVIAGLEGDDSKQIKLRSGNVIQCDLVIRCTGQAANSALLKSFSPKSVSPSGSILVEKTLQIRDAPRNIFALGDVIDLPGPKMGRPATMQGFLVAENILRAIRGDQKNRKRRKGTDADANKTATADTSLPAVKLKEYTPTMVDSSIELTLGLVSFTVLTHSLPVSFPLHAPYTPYMRYMIHHALQLSTTNVAVHLPPPSLEGGRAGLDLAIIQGKSVMFISDGHKSTSIPRKMPDDALHAAQMWKIMDATPYDDPSDKNKAAMATSTTTPTTATATAAPAAASSSLSLSSQTAELSPAAAATAAAAAAAGVAGVGVPVAAKV